MFLKRHHPASFLFLFLGLSFPPALMSAAGGEIVESGHSIDVRLSQELDSETNQSGEAFRALLDQPLVSGEKLLAPAGSPVVGELIEVQSSGKLKGKALMRMTLRSLSVGENSYFLNTNDLEIRAGGSAKQDATLIGGGAGVGAVIGAIIGGKKGAAIGAAVGAGAGTAVVLVTEGKQIRFEKEQLFRFELEEALTLPVLGDAPASEQTAGGTSTGSGSTAPSRSTATLRADLQKAVHGVREASGEVLHTAEQHVSRQQEEQIALESYFAIHSFHSAAHLFSRLWDEQQEVLPVGIKDQLLQQFRTSDETLGAKGMTEDLSQGWESLREKVLELDRLDDAYRESVSHDSWHGRLHWQGRVDGSTSIMLTGNDVSLHLLEGEAARDTSFTLSSPLPAEAVDVEVNQIKGRGTVSLLERPSRWNAYRVVILIEDDQRGSDQYEFELTWK